MGSHQVAACGIGVWLVITLLVTLAPASTSTTSSVGKGLGAATDRAGLYGSPTDRQARLEADPNFLLDRQAPMEVLLNIALFVPFGLLASLTFRRPSIWMITAIGLALSSMIEVTQLFLVISRSAQVRDVLANSIGTLAGALCGRRINHLRRASEPQ